MGLPLDKVCNVEREVPAEDSAGGDVPAWTVRLSNVACCFQPDQPTDNQDFLREDYVGTGRVYTSVDIQAARRDRIVVGGKRYPVIGYKFLSQGRLQIATTYVSIRNGGG